MKKLCAFLAVPLLLLAAPLNAQFLQMVHVQTVVSHYVEDDKTELIGSRPIMAMGMPATVTFKNVTVSFVTTEVDAKTVRISPRLSEKLPDGTTRRHEADSITVPIAQTAVVRLGDYKLELTPTIFELPPPLTIDFPGGPLTELIKTLPKDHRLTFNLVGEKADLATEIPPLFLKLTSADTLAHALNQILATHGLIINSSAGAYGSRSLFVLKRVVDPDAGKPASEPRFRSYQVGDYLLGKQTIDEITGAIRTAWEMTPDAKPDQLVLKYHPGTTLLLITGPEAAIKITENILASLAPGARLSTESARLEAVTSEVRRRRDARLAGVPVEATPAAPLPTTPAVAAPSAESPAEHSQRLQQVADDVRLRREARQASAAELEKRMEELRLETERLRAARPPASKNTPPASPPTAPAATQ